MSHRVSSLLSALALAVALTLVASGCTRSSSAADDVRPISLQGLTVSGDSTPVAAAARVIDLAAAGTGISYGDGTLLVEAGEPGSLRLVDQPGSATLGRRVRCSWHSIGGTGFYPTWDSTTPVFPEPDEVYMLRCFHPDDKSNLTGYPRIVRFVPGAPVDGPAIGIVEVEQYAIDSIEFETPIPALSPPDSQIVGIDTWLGVASQLSYPDASAQAGDTWATVHPAVRSAVWTLGDGSVVTCISDIDKVWDPTLDPSSQSTSCSHNFERVSEPSGYATDLTVSWTIYERTNSHPDDWTIWGVVSRSASVSIVVGELQSVIN